MDTKKCSDCQKTLPITMFYKRADRAKHLYRSKCKECHHRISRKSKKGKHGLTEDEAKLRREGKTCEICSVPAEVVDHCHSTLKLRGNLCSACNTGIGFFDDDPHLLRLAIKYLEKYDGKM